VTGVSFITTIFNKTAFLPRVVEALARQTGSFRREFIFVDDGSTDGSAAMIAELTEGWVDPVVILRQPNRGASAATNAGAARASHTWLKLVDGDDLLLPGATEWLLDAATAHRQDFAYGELGTYAMGDPTPLARDFAVPPASPEADGLARFIRKCPCNSSTMLIGAARYRQAGGCDERLVSPDLALFLRLFARGGAAHLDGPVALIPDKAPGRLSEQRRRSPYESVLALYYLVSETRDLDERYVRLAYRRALARAYRYHRLYGGHRLFTRHLTRLVVSRLGLKTDAVAAMREALGAFTEDGSNERPASWLPGALRQPESK
jgi:glycosyltransferase involved in cell wall biosynthesis